MPTIDSGIHSRACGLSEAWRRITGSEPSRALALVWPTWLAPAVVDLDLGATHLVRHGLGALPDVLFDHQLLLDASLLADHRVFGFLVGLDGALTEEVLLAGNRTVCRSPFDPDVLLPKADLFLDRCLYDITANPNSSVAHVALADPELLFGNRNDLFVRNRWRERRSARGDRASRCGLRSGPRGCRCARSRFRRLWRPALFAP